MGIFRYPGAKSRLLGQLRPHLDTAIDGMNDFCDLFVGGGSVLIDVAERHPGIRLIANDLDTTIASFWRMVAGEGDADRLCELLQQKPTIALFEKLRSDEAGRLEDMAYRAVFLNRTAFSGISTSGPIGGWRQRSKWTIDCRYNADKLIDGFRRLRETLSTRLTVHCEDAMVLLSRLDQETAVYCDPPYFEKGDMLYPVKMTIDDHRSLSTALRGRKRWVLSYDAAPEIANLYEWARIEEISPKYSIDGSKSTWKRKKEFIITPIDAVPRRLLESAGPYHP